MHESPTALADALGILGLGEHVAAGGCALLESLLGQPLEVSSAMVADEIYAWQLRQRLAVASCASRLLKEQDIAPRLLRKGFLLPFLDAAGNADHPELQPLWAQLLASAIGCDYLQHPMLIETLRRMSREDIEVLRELAEPPAGSRVATFGSPGDEAHSQRELAYARLHSLGLLAPWIDPRAQQPLPGQSADPAGKVEEQLLGISRFGWQFIVAVIPDAATPMFRFDPYSCP